MDHEERWIAEREIESPEVLYSFVCFLSRLDAGLHLVGLLLKSITKIKGKIKIAKAWDS